MNSLSTLKVLLAQEEERNDLTDDESFLQRQNVRWECPSFPPPLLAQEEERNDLTDDESFLQRQNVRWVALE